MTRRKRWEEAVDRAAMGEVLSDEERSVLADPPDAIAEDEAEFYLALEDLGRPQPLQPGDLHRVQAALQQRRSTPAPPRRTLIIALAGCIAAAVLLWAVRFGGSARTSTSTVVASVVRGSLAYDSVEVSRRETMHEGLWGTATREACVHHLELDACVAASTLVKHDGDVLELAGGEASLAGSGRLRASTVEFRVVGAHFSLDARGGVSIVVHTGTVVVDVGGETTEVGAGERWPTIVFAEVAPPAENDSTGQPPVPRASDVRSRPKPTSTSTPAELLDRARRLVAAGKVDAALRIYNTLRREHARTPAAQAANVSIGELQLQRGRAKAALRAFSRYLERGGGALAEEAMWGRIRAYHRLGRTRDKQAETQRMRKRFPKSVYLDLASRL